MAEPWIEATIEAYTGVIAKPKMSVKLLTKPPFRFLHDVVMNVISTTGFGDGVFEGDELNGKAIKGKGPKLAFLDKAVALVTAGNGSRPDVNTGKVVAGREAEKTNNFLQLLLKVAQDDSVDRDAVKEQVRAEFAPPDGGRRAGAPSQPRAYR